MYLSTTHDNCLSERAGRVLVNAPPMVHMAVLSALLCAGSGIAFGVIAQPRKTYRVLWRATCSAEGVWQYRSPHTDAISEYDQKLDAYWEGSATIEKTGDSPGLPTFETTSLHHSGETSFHSYYHFTEPRNCSGDPGYYHLYEDLTQSAKAEFGDQEDELKSRFAYWAQYVETHGAGTTDVIEDPFGQDASSFFCNAMNFDVHHAQRRKTWGSLCGEQREPQDLDESFVGPWYWCAGYQVFANNYDGLTRDDPDGASYSKSTDVFTDRYLDMREKQFPVIVHWDITVDIIDDCMLSVPQQYQNRGTYTQDCYDHASDPDGDGLCADSNLAELGCCLTCLSMAMSYVGLPTDPGTLNAFMLAPENNLFLPNGDFYLVTTVAAYSQQSLAFEQEFVSSQSSPEAAREKLDAIVCNKGYPALVGVGMTGSGAGDPKHWVLVVGRESNRWVLNDPYYPGNRFLDEYGDYQVFGYVEPVGPVMARVGPQPAPALRTRILVTQGRARAVISLELDKPGSVEVSMFTPHGRQILQRVRNYTTSGSHHFVMDLAADYGRALAPGAYPVCIRKDGCRETLRLVVTGRR